MPDLSSYTQLDKFYREHGGAQEALSSLRDIFRSEMGVEPGSWGFKMPTDESPDFYIRFGMKEVPQSLMDQFISCSIGQRIQNFLGEPIAVKLEKIIPISIPRLGISGA